MPIPDDPHMTRVFLTARARSGGERGKRQFWVEAGLVRRGSHAESVAAAEEQSRRLWPRLLAWASLAAALVVALLPPPQCPDQRTPPARRAARLEPMEALRCE